MTSAAEAAVSGEEACLVLGSVFVTEGALVSAEAKDC